MIIVSKNLHINGNGFVFDYYTGVTYGLNPVGRLVLGKLVEGVQVDDIVHALENSYGLSHRVAVSDVDDFIQQLSSLNLITVTDDVSHDSL